MNQRANAQSPVTTASTYKKLYAGISGIVLPVPKYLFPPAHQSSSRLTYYATFFNSLEVNSSFYKIPMPATVGKWAASVPDAFKFTFKLYREITHCKGLAFKKQDLEQFFKAVDQVGEKKGSILVQFPPSVGRELVVGLQALLGSIREMDPLQQWNIAVEFRNRSWYQPEVYNLLDGFNAALVVQDIPKSATPAITHTSEFVYVRFHGPTGNYRESYPESFLYEYAGYLRDWLSEGKTVYVYFNNTMGDAFKNLQTLQKLI